MSDVFLSYARENQIAAEALAKALEAEDLSVWWDRHIVAGFTFDDVIEDELDSAGSVIVLWSEASVGSEWVRCEASAAAERGVLIPVSLDGQRPPLEFRRKQTVSLTDWAGERDHPGFVQVLHAIRQGAAMSEPPDLPVSPAPASPAKGWPQWLLVPLGLAVLVGLFVLRAGPPDVPPPPPAASEAAAAAPKPAHTYRWELVASNIDDDVYVEINAIERFKKAGGQATFDLTPYLTGGDDRVNVRLGNGNCFGSSLNVQFLRDGKPYGGTARHQAALSHCGWQFDWEWVVNRTSGVSRRAK
ncbi:MAG: toll/interleukin-1 receptor domain-containing protein [Rhodocyclaceae bacterium]|nr:toll/interleukin-1 receptor domain-containing protein [Rhodocyclaceae bacterium]